MMQTAINELERSKNVWRRAIDRLQHKIAALMSTDDFFEGVGPDTDERDESIGEMERQITIYRMCIDWARDQQELLAGHFHEESAIQRQRFYKLMTALAEAELDRDDHKRSVAFVSSPAIEHPTNQQSVDELQAAATITLQTLLGDRNQPRLRSSKGAEYTDYSRRAADHSDSRFA